MSPAARPASAADVRRAAQAADLETLAAYARQCTACADLAAYRQQVVVGDTPPKARLLVLGEAPGASEDASGEPFVGRSGQLLALLLAEVGLPRAEVAILNTVKCRPPGNRPPTRIESATCRPFTQRQLQLLAPAVVVALGLSATRWFLGPTPLGPVRGRLHDVDGVRVLPTYHPSAALRHGPQGEPRRLLREDLALAVRTCR